MGQYTKMIGKSIRDFTLTHIGDLLTLYCTDGMEIDIIPQGDCCSCTWIESIDTPDVLLGGTIRAVEDREMPSKGNVSGVRHHGVEYVQYYGLAITTEKGMCVIDYRNDSNGYYGGWVNIKVRG